MVLEKLVGSLEFNAKRLLNQSVSAIFILKGSCLECPAKLFPLTFDLIGLSVSKK